MPRNIRTFSQASPVGITIITTIASNSNSCSISRYVSINCPILTKTAVFSAKRTRGSTRVANNIKSDKTQNINIPIPSNNYVSNCMSHRSDENNRSASKTLRLAASSRMGLISNSIYTIYSTSRR